MSGEQNGHGAWYMKREEKGGSVGLAVSWHGMYYMVFGLGTT